MNVLQASLTPLELSEDQGVTWKQLICVAEYNAPMETQTTETDTFCGIAVGMGPIKFGPTGTAVCDFAPNSTQVSHDNMLNWQVEKELIMYRLQNPGVGTGGPSGSFGQFVYQTGKCYVTKTDLKLVVNDVIKFDFTLLGVGVPSINPPNLGQIINIGHYKDKCHSAVQMALFQK